MAGSGAASVRDHRAEIHGENQRCSTLAQRGIHMVNTPHVSGEGLFLSPSIDTSVFEGNPQVPDHGNVAEVWLEDSLLLPSGAGGYRQSTVKSRWTRSWFRPPLHRPVVSQSRSSPCTLWVVSIIEDRTHQFILPTIGRDFPFQVLGFVLESRPTKTPQKDKRGDCVIRKCPQILKITNSPCHP